jgi:thiomorpholine-carboxylate dehydrogenase
MPVFLGPEQVEKYIDLQQLYLVLEDAFRSFSKGKCGGVIQPVRTVLHIEKYNG